MAEHTIAQQHDKNLQCLIEGVAAVAGLLAAEPRTDGRVEAEAAWIRWELGLRAITDDVPLADLVLRFRLNSFEVRCLVLTLASHIEPRMAALVATTSKDTFARGVTIRLAMERFCATATERVNARQSFLPSAPMMRHHMIALGRTEVGSNEGLLSRKMELTTPTLRYLLKENELSESLAKLARMEFPQVSLFNVIIDSEHLTQVRQLVENHRDYRRAISEWGFDKVLPYGRGLTFLFSGPPGTGKTLLAHALASHAGRPILSLSAADIPDKEGVEKLIDDLLTEAAMRDAIVLIDECEALLGKGDKRKATAFKAIEDFEGILVLITNHPHQLDEGLERRIMYHLPFEVPDNDIRRQIWEVHLPPEVPLEGDIDLDILANTYDFSGGTIKNAILFAVNLALAKNPKSPRLTMELLEEGCKAQLRYALEDLTVRSSSKLRLKDIILPEKPNKKVKEIVAACRNQAMVLNSWGFGKKLVTGKGITCLFDGPPGTGKTLCAEIISGELDRPLYRVNIPEVVSKWVGETEKNIKAIFQQARISHAMLLFDEADSLFASRMAETKSSTDRYANMEVNLLLQEIERFPGIVILTTNFFGSLDKALIRRIQFRVTFEEPDEEGRARIWRTLCPAETPLHEDVSFERLAKHFEMTGGMIKNALVRAAYMACDIGSPITQQILAESCLDEYQAAGKVARDPAAKPAARLVIPEGAVELPPDWQDRGIPPELLVRAGVGDADLGAAFKAQLRATPRPGAPVPIPAPGGNGRDEDEAGEGATKPGAKTRPIPGVSDDDYPEAPRPTGPRRVVDG
ncbi:MAG: AAA family ATPase [Deltaproteobacteria bacterium]|nr:AAA family ATPase [Deltaproteobacteria bacterium]